MNMTDTERLDKIEALCLSHHIGNGVAIFPVRSQADGKIRFFLQDLGAADGRDMGEELTPLKLTLREVIDALL